jgi:hypothetical protein
MLGIKVCDKCKFVWSEDEQLSICPHDKKQKVDEDHDQEIKRLFHTLWSQNVGTVGYVKANWMELQRRLQARGINI